MTCVVIMVPITFLIRLRKRILQQPPTDLTGLSMLFFLSTLQSVLNAVYGKEFQYQLPLAVALWPGVVSLPLFLNYSIGIISTALSRLACILTIANMILLHVTIQSYSFVCTDQDPTLFDRVVDSMILTIRLYVFFATVVYSFHVFRHPTQNSMVMRYADHLPHARARPRRRGRGAQPRDRGRRAGGAHAWVMQGVILAAPDAGGGLEQAVGDVEEAVGSGRRLRSIVQVRAYLNRRLVGEEDSVEEGGVDMGAAA